jgi:hypothetical protein
MLTVVHDVEESNDNTGPGRSLLDEIVRDGARKMLAAALEAEVAAYIAQFTDVLDENGYRLVVRNGHHEERTVLTAAGAVPVKAPRVNDKRIDAETGQRCRFSSAILPAWARKSPQMAEVLPLLYLHGLSSGDFGPALEQFLGTGAGLSASAITRLTAQWQDEAKAFGARDLSPEFTARGVNYCENRSPKNAGQPKRQIRDHQHPPEGINQARLRIPQPGRTDSHGPAHPRRPLPSTTRTEMTHYNVSRSGSGWVFPTANGSLTQTHLTEMSTKHPRCIA